LDGFARVSPEPLVFAERLADGDPAGLLVLHHGRGADEHDLLGLADVLDPGRRLHVVTPGGPLTVAGWPGRHWYLVERVGHPDPATFYAARAALAALHDELWQRTGLGPHNTVLGGFSMGCVMSYALGLDPGRPAPRGILALSGFIPTVEGWSADLAERADVEILIAHGRADPVIQVDFAREAARVLGAAGLALEYLESDAGHHVEPAQLPRMRAWLEATLGLGGP
jgi:phospholipase/carboxylesterase